jgi:hypothetical protein
MPETLDDRLEAQRAAALARAAMPAGSELVRVALAQLSQHLDPKVVPVQVRSPGRCGSSAYFRLVPEPEAGARLEG